MDTQVSREALLRHAQRFGVGGIEELIDDMVVSPDAAALLKLEVNEAAAKQETLRRFEDPEQIRLTKADRGRAARLLLGQRGAKEATIIKRVGAKSPAALKQLIAAAEEEDAEAVRN